MAICYAKRSTQLITCGVRADRAVVETATNARILFVAIRIAVANGKAVQKAAINRSDLDVARYTLVQRLDVAALQVRDVHL